MGTTASENADAILRRFLGCLSRCQLSSREVAAALGERGIDVSHTTVNRWREGHLPRVDQLRELAAICNWDLTWILHGGGPPPWELSHRQRLLLEAADVIGVEEALRRLMAAPTPPPPPAEPGHDLIRTRHRGVHRRSDRRE